MSAPPDLLAEITWCMENAAISARVHDTLAKARSVIFPELPASPLFKRPARDRILIALKSGPLTSGQIVDRLGIHRSTATRTLLKLRDDGLVVVSNAYDGEANEMRNLFTLKPNAP